VIKKWFLIQLITSKYQWAQLVLQWIHHIDVHQRVMPKMKHLVLQMLLRWNLVLRYIHLPEIRHKMPRTLTLSELMLLHQDMNGLIHYLVYMVVMTIDFNINMIVWNLEKERST
jgi:hypothetical protein